MPSTVGAMVMYIIGNYVVSATRKLTAQSTVNQSLADVSLIYVHMSYIIWHNLQYIIHSRTQIVD